MKLASFSFAIFALVTGLIAANYWYQSSKVEVVPLWQELGSIEPLGGSDTHWIVGMLKAAEKSGALNKLAARWTAASVVLGACSAVIGAWPFAS